MEWLESVLSANPVTGALWPVLVLAIRTSLLLAIAWAASRLVESAATRHLVWAAALGILLLLPLGALLPAVELEGLPQWLAPRAEVDRSSVIVAADAPRPASGDAGAMSSPVAETDASRWPPSGSDAGSSAPAFGAVLDGPARAGSLVGGAVDEGPRSQAGGLRLAVVLFVLSWLTGAGWLAARVGAGLLARRRLLAASQPVDPGRQRRLLRLASELGITRRVRLAESDRVQVPMTWGVRTPVVLVPSSARNWSDDLLDSVLLHELAHVRRCDAVVGLVGAGVRVVYWPHPMVWGAYRALRRESERAADDVVIRTSVPPVDYAQHLLAAVQSLRRPVPEGVAAMASRPQLAGRIGAILDESRHRAGPGGRARLLLLAGALLALVATAVPVTPASRPAGEAGTFAALGSGAELAAVAPEDPDETVARGAPDDPDAPGITVSRPSAAAPSSPAPSPTRLASLVPGRTAGRSATPVGRSALFDEACGDGSSSSSFTVEDGHQSIRASTGRCEVRIESTGTVDFTADEGGIRHMAAGSRLMIEERGPGVSRRMRIEPGPAGRPVIAWIVDDEARAFDASAEAWLARMIPEIFRLTGWQAEERVGRLLSTGGLEAVLGEVTSIYGDHVQATYLLELLEQASLSGRELERCLRLAGGEIGSDHELGRVLQSVSLARLSDAGVQESFVEAASTIGSDHGLRRTLEHLLRHDALSAELLRPLLRVAGSIGSDFELTELLITICRRFPPEQALPEAFYDVATTIGSDHEMRRALDQLSGRPMASGDFTRALDLARQIGSDHELAELLIDLSGRLPEGQPLPPELYEAVATIGSDHEMGRVLARLVERPLEVDSLTRFLELSRQIGSDFELAEFLVGLLQRHGDPVGAREAFEAAVETIGSRSERARVTDAWKHAGA